MSTTAIPETEQRQTGDRATPFEHDRRIRQVIDWLLDGRPRAEVIPVIMGEFQLGLRSAQLYVLEAQRRLAAESADYEQLYYLRLSQHQRDRLLATVLHYIGQAPNIDPKLLRALTGLASAACKLLDSRNAAAKMIHEHLKTAQGQPALDVDATVKMLRQGQKDIEEQYRQERAQAASAPVTSRVPSDDQDEEPDEAEDLGEEVDEEEFDPDMVGDAIRVARARHRAGIPPPLSGYPMAEPWSRDHPPRSARESLDRRLQEDFLASQRPQVLPPIVPPPSKSKPDKENGALPGVIDHSPGVARVAREPCGSFNRDPKGAA